MSQFDGLLPEEEGPVEPVQQPESVPADEPLPADIEKVWGGGRLDSSGMLAETTARYLIGEWGVERFRASAIHRAALQDQMHSRARSDARSDFRRRDLKAQ